MKYYGQYDYLDALKAATASDATQDDRMALGEWFENYGSMYWNGEEYDLSDFRAGCVFRPVYKEISEDEFEIIDYEII